MQSRNILLSLSAGFIIGLFAIPILVATGLWGKIPSPLLLLFVLFPLLVVSGMIIAEFIGKKIPIIFQLAKFALVGVVNTAVDFGILNFLITIFQITSGVGIIFINATSFMTALFNSYFWNKDWVFETGKKHTFIGFVTITLIGLSINTSIVFLITTFIPPIYVESETLWANIAKVLATGVSLVWNFAGYKLIVFKR